MKYDYRRQINKNYCVPACLQMILARRGHELSQDDIFSALPQKDNQILLYQENIEGFLKDFNLKVELLHKKTSFISPDEMISLESENDFMAAYFYNMLHDKDYIARHVSLVEKIQQDEIYLLDPRERIKKVEYKKLNRAMPNDKQCGFYFIHT